MTVLTPTRLCLVAALVFGANGFTVVPPVAIDVPAVAVSISSSSASTSASSVQTSSSNLPSQRQLLDRIGSLTVADGAAAVAAPAPATKTTTATVAATAPATPAKATTAASAATAPVAAAAKPTTTTAATAPATTAKPTTTATTATATAPAAAAAAAAKSSTNVAKGAGISIADIFFDGKVPKTEADEYVVIQNSSKNNLDVSGYILYPATSGTQGSTFKFPKGSTIKANSSVKVYTNEIHKESGGYSWGSGKALWSNKGGLAVLKDNSGKKLGEYKYVPKS